MNKITITIVLTLFVALEAYSDALSRRAIMKYREQNGYTETEIDVWRAVQEALNTGSGTVIKLSDLAKQNAASPEAQASTYYTITYGNYTDSRDGETYKTITVDGITWMAENMRYRNTQQEHCKKHKINEQQCRGLVGHCFLTDDCHNGVLYRLGKLSEIKLTTKGMPHAGYYNSVCPNEDGWYLPTFADFSWFEDILENTVAGTAYNFYAPFDGVWWVKPDGNANYRYPDSLVYYWMSNGNYPTGMDETMDNYIALGYPMIKRVDDAASPTAPTFVPTSGFGEKVVSGLTSIEPNSMKYKKDWENTAAKVRCVYKGNFREACGHDVLLSKYGLERKSVELYNKCRQLPYNEPSYKPAAPSGDTIQMEKAKTGK